MDMYTYIYVCMCVKGAYVQELAELAAIILVDEARARANCRVYIYVCMCITSLYICIMPPARVVFARARAPRCCYVREIERGCYTSVESRFLNIDVRLLLLLLRAAAVDCLSLARRKNQAGRALNRTVCCCGWVSFFFLCSGLRLRKSI